MSFSEYGNIIFVKENLFNTMHIDTIFNRKGELIDASTYQGKKYVKVNSHFEEYTLGSRIFRAIKEHGSN
ncbi:MAG: hypothetical protein H0W50_11780 [Parachlamydiaceae bacterium]|nr:hypothetical protein [Parachlamydiaceae bacterium]